MRLRAFITSLVVVVAPTTIVTPMPAVAGPASPALVRTIDDPDGGGPPPSTFNEFYPDERPLGDCLNNSIPLPNCGSGARGGWTQNVVFLAILAGLGFIAWRVVAASRKARASLSRTPSATSAPDVDGGGRAP